MNPRSRFVGCSLVMRSAALLFLCILHIAAASSRGQGEVLTGSELSLKISAAHKQFLEIPGGVKISYHLIVAQDRRLGGFGWEGGRGRIVIRWPKIYNMYEGRNAKTHLINSREGEHDFISEISAGRDNQMVFITPYRQAWSAVHLFPLHFLFMEEADQHYVLGEGLKTDYWLPSALNQGRYAWKETVDVDGVRCEVYRRDDDLDTISVAHDHGFTVCLREIRDKSKRLIESVRNTKLKEIRPHVWFPMVQLQHRYSKDPSVPKWNLAMPTCTLKVVVDDVSIGGVKDDELHIQMPSGSIVDDQILNSRYQRSGSGVLSLETSIKSGKDEAFKSNSWSPIEPFRSTTIVLGILLIVMTTATAHFGYRRFRGT